MATFNDLFIYFSPNCQKVEEKIQASGTLSSWCSPSTGYLQAPQPYRSRSSHSLRGGKHTAKREESPSHKCYTRQSLQKHPSKLLSSISGSSGSSFSSSYLNSPSPMRKTYSNYTKKEQFVIGRTENLTLNRHSRNISTSQPHSDASSASLSINSGSNSSSTSYLPSPRPTRSRSSHSPHRVQEVRRQESPGAKSYNSSSTASSRHGWLYSQQYNCTADTTRGKGDRYNNSFVIRYFKLGF